MAADRTPSAATNRVWKHGPAEGTTGWHGRFHIGRLQIGWHLYQHASRHGDRWVLQPFFIYDRRPA